MEDRNNPRLPIWAIILDVIGALLLALGILALISVDTLALPEFLDASAFGVVLIFAGLLLTLPLIIILVRRATSQR